MGAPRKCLPLPPSMGAQHVAGQNDGVFLPQQMLEHVLGKKYGEIFPRHVLGVLSRTENRDFGLRQNKLNCAPKVGHKKLLG